MLHHFGLQFTQNAFVCRLHDNYAERYRNVSLIKTIAKGICVKSLHTKPEPILLIEVISCEQILISKFLTKTSAGSENKTIYGGIITWHTHETELYVFEG